MGERLHASSMAVASPARKSNSSARRQARKKGTVPLGLCKGTVPFFQPEECPHVGAERARKLCERRPPWKPGQRQVHEQVFVRRCAIASHSVSPVTCRTT